MWFSRRGALTTVVAAIAGATLAVYARVATHDFIGLDDPAYVFENDRVNRGLTLEGVRWALVATDVGNWHPLTWISHMVDVELFGLAPGWHHLSSLLFHVANALLLLLVLRRMTGLLWPSALVSALFAFHPLHVESVAWIAERKDVLSAFFWILSMGFYTRYVEAPGFLRYLATLFAFAAGLMAKPMLVTLPLVLLLLDYWPLERVTGEDRAGGGQARFIAKARFARIAGEKVPLLLLSFLSSAITIFAQHKGRALIPIEAISCTLRMENALVAYATYVAEMFWPHSLSVYYPHPGEIPAASVAKALVLLGTLSFLAVRSRRTRPYFLVGWLWFLGTLVPVIGLVQVGNQAMADRYTYIPLIGLFIALAWGTRELCCRSAAARLSICAAWVLALVCMGFWTWVQVGYWRTTDTLFRHALRVTPNNSTAHTVLGNDLLARGRAAEAVIHYQRAIAIDPDYARAHNNLAAALVELGRVDEAIEHCRTAIRLEPDHAGWHLGLAVALHRKELLDQAIPSYLRALELDPADVRALNGLGVAYMETGEIGQAIKLLSQALELRPTFGEAHYNLGLALARGGDPGSAAGHFRKAISLGLSDADTHYQLGEALRRSGNLTEARRHYEAALEIDPQYREASRALREISREGKGPKAR